MARDDTVLGVEEYIVICCTVLYYVVCCVVCCVLCYMLFYMLYCVMYCPDDSTFSHPPLTLVTPSHFISLLFTPSHSLFTLSHSSLSFRKKPISSSKAKRARKIKLGREDEEHLVSAVASLVLHLDASGDGYKRMLVKFYQSDFEKLDRLLELYETYV